MRPLSSADQRQPQTLRTLFPEQASASAPSGLEAALRAPTRSPTASSQADESTTFPLRPPKTRRHRQFTEHHRGPRGQSWPAMKRKGSDAVMMVHRWNRPLLSCEPCRERKRRCDRQRPCATCSRRGVLCNYNTGGEPLNAIGNDKPEPSPAVLPSSSAAVPLDPTWSQTLFAPVPALGHRSRVAADVVPGATRRSCAASRGWKAQSSTTSAAPLR